MYVIYNTQTKEVLEGDSFSNIANCYVLESPLIWIETSSNEFISWDEKRYAEQLRLEREQKEIALREQNPDLFEYFAQKQAITNNVLETLILEALNV
jgi:hypothetical protein